MNRLAILCATFLAVATSPSAFADLQRVQFHNSFGTTGGGEFRIETIDWDIEPASLELSLFGQPDRFEAFCVERNEYISYGTIYHVEFSDEAKNGGVAGGNPDPISDETRYLYSQFINGQLAAYDYGNGAARVSSANALQRVIWYLEDEFGLSTPPPGGFNSLEQTFLNDAIANATTAGGLGAVRVMNVYGNAAHTAAAQDQLVMFTPIPAPGAVLLGTVGIGMVGWVRRRFA